MGDRTWVVAVQEVHDGLVTLGSPEHHQTALTLSTADWIEMARPGTLHVSPRRP